MPWNVTKCYIWFFHNVLTIFETIQLVYLQLYFYHAWLIWLFFNLFALFMNHTYQTYFNVHISFMGLMIFNKSWQQITKIAYKSALNEVLSFVNTTWLCPNMTTINFYFRYVFTSANDKTRNITLIPNI